MRRRMLAWPIIVAVVIICGAGAVLADGPDGVAVTSGGAISVPEAPLLPPPLVSALVDVSLPDDIPFEIIIFSSTKTGVIQSSEFQITNNSGFPVDIALCNVKLHIADPGDFSVRSDENLPEEGSNIHMSMVCENNAATSSFTLGETPKDADFVYALESGASGSFRFEGAVNEYGTVPWSETTVTVSMRFAVSSASLPVETPVEQPVFEETAAPDGLDAPDASQESPAIEDETPAAETQESEMQDKEMPTANDEATASGDPGLPADTPADIANTEAVQAEPEYPVD